MNRTIQMMAVCGSLVSLVGCDEESSRSEKGAAAPAVSILVGDVAVDAPEEGGAQRVRVEVAPEDPGADDPCASYGPDPGATLTHDTQFDGEVFVADYCISAIENVIACWVSDHEEVVDGMYVETDDIDVWCEFECDSTDFTVSLLESYPAPGQERRIEVENPCPPVVVPE